MSDLPTFTNGALTACPECGGSGLMTYPDVGDDCPCMTCSDGLYERGTGTIPAPPFFTPTMPLDGEGRLG